MSKELDIYEDLDNYNTEQKFKEKCNEIVELQEKYKSSIETINDLQNENMGFQKKVKNIERSFWSLLETAKLEVRRKERYINELRQEIDNITFRRYNSKTAKKSGERSWFQKDDARDISINFENGDLFKASKNHQESLKSDTPHFCTTNVPIKTRETHEKKLTPEETKYSKSDKITKISSLNSNIKYSEDSNKINETKNVQNQNKLKSEKRTKITDDSIKFKILQDVNKINKKIKNAEKQSNVKNSLELTVVNLEYSAKNIEDLIFDEMLDESNSLNVKNTSIDIFDDEKTSENKKHCEHMQVDSINTEPALRVKTFQENTYNIENQKNIRNGCIENIKVEISKTFHEMEEELLCEKNKGNYAISLVESSENLNNQEKQEQAISDLCETETSSNLRYDNLSNNFENKIQTPLDIDVHLDCKDESKLNSTQELRMENSSLNKNDIKFSQSQMEYKIHQSQGFLKNSDPDNEKEAYEESSTCGKENILEKCDKKRNIKPSQELLGKSDQFGVKENLNKNNESGVTIKNKNDKFVGHKIDGFKPKNTEKQGKEAYKLKQTLFQEIISANKKCVDKYKFNKEFVTKIGEIDQITAIKNCSKDQSKMNDSILLDLEYSNSTMKRNLVSDESSSALIMVHDTVSQHKPFNECEENVSDDMKTQNRKINISILKDNQEISQINERKDDGLTSQIVPFKLEKYEMTLTNQKKDGNIKNFADNSEIILESLSQYQNGKTHSKINILQNIQIAPPNGDKAIYSIPYEKENETNSNQVPPNPLPTQTVSVIDVKPNILKPDINKILPLMNNSVEANRTATDELVKILDDVPQVSQVITPRKRNNNLDEKFIKSSHSKHDMKILKSSPDEFKFSSCKSEAAKNSNSPNQSETLEAIKFLTDNLLEIGNESSPFKELKNLSLESSKGDHFENITQKSDSGKYLNKTINKHTETQNENIASSKKKCSLNMLESEKQNKFDKINLKTSKNIIPKKIKQKFVKEANVIKRSQKTTINEESNKLRKNNEEAKKNPIICKSKLKNKENVLNSIEKDNKKNSMELLNDPIGESISELCITTSNQSGTNDLKLDVVSFDITSMKHKTNSGLTTENETDFLQEEIDNIFGKSPFNNNTYIESLKEIKCSTNHESKDMYEELNYTNDSLNKLCTLNKKYEMEMDDDGVPIWNIIKKRKRKRKSAEEVDDKYLKNDIKRVKSCENPSQEKDVSNGDDRTNENLCISNAGTELNLSNNCNKIITNNYQKNFLSSYKIPKIKKSSNYENTIENFDANIRLENHINKKKSELSTEHNVYHHFKSPHQVEQNLEDYENNVEQEFLRIFGKSPPNENYLQTTKTENDCSTNLNYDSPNSDHLNIKIEENPICDKEINNQNTLNISTNHDANETQHYFITSTKTYEMQHDVSDGTVNWIIKRKKRKFKVN